MKGSVESEGRERERERGAENSHEVDPSTDICLTRNLLQILTTPTRKASDSE